MRRLIALMLAALLLTGCTAHPPETTAPPPAGGWEAVGGSGDLWYVPNETAEAMEIRQLLPTQDGLLLCCGGAEELMLALLSQEDLSVTAGTTIPASELAFVQVLEDAISIADPGNGTVTMLTSSLDHADTISSGAGTKTWLMSLDGGTLLTLSQAGIEAHDLRTGTSRRLLDSRMLTVVALTGERISLASVGQENLMTRWYELDLRSCTLTELEESRMIALQEGLQPQSTGSYLRLDGQELTLYDREGGFLSACTLSGETSRYGRDFVWSERWQGWFFVEYVDGSGRLLFWDPADQTSGADMDIAPEPVPEGAILDPELYARAEELSRRFDLDIRIADRCIRDYAGYDSEMLTDPQVTADALDVLEEILSQYPEGFFAQLKYANRHSVRIELVDDLAGKSGHDVSSGTSAFTVRRDRDCLIVLNARRIRASVIYHEFSHVIDDRMAWEAMLRSDALYSEERWLELQPEGFEYADSYQNIPEHVTAFYDSGYFAGSYACVSATEDRAMTLQNAMMGEREVFEANPHLMPKLEYYCACIRDSFDTEGWPEVTIWEQLLQQAG